MTIYVTEALADGLLDMANDAEPAKVSLGLEVTRAGDLVGSIDIDPETAVFTHFYFPTDDRSVNAVFGMDFSTPIGRTSGRFVSHPQGTKGVSTTDDLHATMLVAVPPWDRASLAAFDRRGRGVQIHYVDAVPTDDVVPE